MGLKPDHWIRKMAYEHRMIEPFDGALSNKVDNRNDHADRHNGPPQRGWFDTAGKFSA